jgi:hypothetical protein
MQVKKGSRNQERKNKKTHPSARRLRGSLSLVPCHEAAHTYKRHLSIESMSRSNTNEEETKRRWMEDQEIEPSHTHRPGPENTAKTKGLTMNCTASTPPWPAPTLRPASTSAPWPGRAGARGSLPEPRRRARPDGREAAAARATKDAMGALVCWESSTEEVGGGACSAGEEGLYSRDGLSCQKTPCTVENSPPQSLLYEQVHGYFLRNPLLSVLALHRAAANPLLVPATG